MTPLGVLTSTPCPNRGRGRTIEQPGHHVVGELAEHDHDSQRAHQCQLPLEERKAPVPLLGKWFVGRRGAAYGRRHPHSLQMEPVMGDTDIGWLASPTRYIEANSQSPDRSPVKIRPVRLAPWAAGARPTTAIGP